MTGILAGLRIVEGSAFIAAPLGGMTLAQLGADVIRFDDIKGGLESNQKAIGLCTALFAENPSNAGFRRVLAVRVWMAPSA